MNILFVCRHNRFRSKVAEALFRHHYKGDSVKTRSAGLSVNMTTPFIGRGVHHIMKEKGISIRDDGAARLEPFLFKWADKMIIVADNVSPEMFRDREMLGGKPIAIWPITDTSETDMDGIRARVNDIEKRVLELIGELK